ncbi:MAG: type II toxin-antitoxin system HicB family antitoxin [Nitrospirota bacterium]
MKFRAVVKKVEDWWIGWLVDIPGVNAQERTKEALVDSLKIGAEDMFMTNIELPSDSKIEMINIPLFARQDRIAV